MQKNMSNEDVFDVTVLGTGTSSGVPTIGCDCAVCTSDDPKNIRTRCAVLIQSDTTSIVIDAGTDFRQQMLAHRIKKLDAVIFTHHHFDHIGGFDDIRAFNFHTHKPMPIYTNKKTLKELQRTFVYSFSTPEQEGGGVPMVLPNIIGRDKFLIGDIHFEPLTLYHGNLEVLGFRVKDFAYCTDTNCIPERTLDKLQGVKILILDALRYTPHPTHFNIDEAIDIVGRINPDMTYFTHITHDVMHADLEAKLPKNIRLAYDGLKLRI